MYFTTSNNLRKYLSVAGVSSYSTRSLIIRKKAKKAKKKQKKNTSILVIFGSDTHILDAKTNPFITFGSDILAYLKHIGVQIKEKKTCKTASCFWLFWEKYRAEKARL